ncbi:MAG: hypothetical protein WDM70_07865 [Nitrosomonadales bacterium]
MRTTLSIDDDVLAAAKGLASLQRKSVGEVISELTRQALRPNTQGVKYRNGIPLLPVRSGADAVTPELVNQLRDELPG